MRKQLRAVTLQWYVTREFLTLFTVTLMAVTVMFLLLLAFGLVSEFEAMGASLGQVLMLSPFFMPRAIIQALPPAAMIASIMVFGRMSAENEILAAQAGGAPLRILTMPLIFCSFVLAACSLWFQAEGVRMGNTFIREQVLKINQPEFFQNIDKPGSSFSIQPDATSTVRINLLPEKAGPVSAEHPAGKRVRPIQIIYFQNGKQGQTIFAEDHEFTNKPGDRALIVRLTDVQISGAETSYFGSVDQGVPLPDIGAMITIGNTSGQISWIENRDIARRIAREEHLRWEFMMRRAGDFGALTAAGSPLDGSSPAFVANGWNETQVHMDAIVADRGALNRMKVENIEYHRKVSLSLLPISMIVLGIGLGLLVKKSNRLTGFLVGVALYFILYIPLTVVAKSLSSVQQLGQHAWAAQYMPSVLFLIGGLALCVGYERGHITSLPAFLRPSTYINFSRIADGFKWLYGLILKIVGLPVRLLFFNRTTDRYIATTFLTPLIVIVVCIAGLVPLFDVLEHHNEIVDGIVNSDKPLGNLPKRTEWEAVVDLFAYYGIQALEITLDILPLEVLLAGMLCAMVLVRNQEHLILKSSGVRLQRALMPVLFLTILACLGVSVVREFAMPKLVMRRDFLKPQIYHRTPQSSAFALYTFDEKKKPLLFVVSQYESATKTGRDLRVHLLGDTKNKRTPMISADWIKWDGKAWELWTDPAAQEAALLAQKSFGGSPKEPKKPVLATAVPELKRGGVYSVTESPVTPGDAASRDVDAELMRSITVRKSQMNSWPGIVDPKYIDSERPTLGAKVMRLHELEALSEFKPALKVEWYRRVSEALMGLLLLCCALPLMFNDNTGSPVKAIIVSILFAGAYWGSIEFASSCARNNQCPNWYTLLPHGGFFLIAMVQYFRRLQT